MNKKTIFISSLMVFFVIVMFLLIGYRKEKMAYVWFGIQPCRSTEEDVAEILGIPEEISGLQEYTTHKYSNIFTTLDYHQLYIWFMPENEKLIVNGILLIDLMPINQDSLDINPLLLSEFTDIYGKPNRVYWSTMSDTRFLTWFDDGVAVNASAGTTNTTPLKTEPVSEQIIYSILYFCPMSKKDFEGILWPWPNYPWTGYKNMNINVYPQTDAPDSLPRDPYDWSGIPSR